MFHIAFGLLRLKCKTHSVAAVVLFSFWLKLALDLIEEQTAFPFFEQLYEKDQKGFETF
jgi:hypothetical protein